MKLTAESTVINDTKLNTNIDNAQATADGAQTSADNAQGTANTAVTKADNAQGTANTAVTKADNAQGTADTAVSKADNAQSTADTAVSKADTAQATANQAKTIADNTAQYFWFTSSGSDTGAHISEKAQAEFIADPSGGNLLARSTGIAVRDGTTELATFGADGLRIGKDTERNIKITNDSFNVYYEDASVPFSIKTATSATSQTRTFTSSVAGSSGASNTLTIYPLGEVTNNRYYVGVSTTGSPTSYTQYFENPTSTWSATKTINGVDIQILKASDAVVYIKYTNTTTSKRYIGARFTQAYRQTTVRVNDANLNTEAHSATFTDTVGVCQQIHVYTYGKVAHLYMYCYNTSSVVSGVAIYRGQLLNYVPAIRTSLTGVFQSTEPIIGYIDSNGAIYVGNTSTKTITSSASSMIYLTATYLMQ